MTIEQQSQIEREFKDARTPEAVTLAQTHAILALIDCQRKTAERVKKLSWKVFAVVFSLGGGSGAVLSNLEALRHAFGL